MVGRALQLALREMQGHFGDKRVLAGMLVVAGVLGVAGPFGTFDELGLGARLAYWAAMVVVTYGLGYATAMVVSKLIGPQLPQPWLRVLVLGVIVGVPVTLSVFAVNFIALGTLGLDPLSLWLQCTLIGMGVITLTEILQGATKPAVTVPVPAEMAQPPILDRVPLPARGELRALVVQDHYVEVVTARGKTLVLMRLSDAIREVGAVPGVQIHRSHWVALAAVSKVVRAEGKLFVELADGTRLPVSRGYLAAAKAAGIG